MKILYYNWVQFDDPERRGGGVTVYLNNVVNEMVSRRHDVYFLSSGLAYDLAGSRSYIRATKSQVPSCKTFEIVNSSVMAPSHAFWGCEEVSLCDASMERCLLDFVNTYGPFDVVHFHNLEGISLPLVSKRIFGGAKLFHSAHNYYSVCPQVNLWRYETANCQDHNSGQSCTYCLPHTVSLKRNILHYQARELAKTLGCTARTRMFDRVVSGVERLRSAFHMANRLRYLLYLKKSSNPIWRAVYGKKNSIKRAEILRQRRNLVARALIQNEVTTLTVSGRTQEVLRKFGLQDAELWTSYIGTKHATSFKSTTLLSAPRVPQRLSISYLGYMRRDKGFYFFLECLERMPRSLSRHIHVTVAAKNNGDSSLERLMKLNEKFGSVSFYDGFTSGQLDDILKDVDLGVIPSLWEDNLPQVAIETVSRGIPVITSDLGGAKEISGNPAFIYSAGDHMGFIRTLARIVDGTLPLGEYWKHDPVLHSLQDHADELERSYCRKQTGSGAAM